MNVLICSQYGECQVDEVCVLLRKMGVNPVIFERYRKDQFVTYKYDKTKVHAFLQTAENEYPLNSETFPAVWYRPKPILGSEIPGGINDVKEKFCFQEWRVILQSLEHVLTNSIWINPILDNHKAANKAYQLKMAQEEGLQIPETIITNDANMAYDLFDKGRVIYKTLSSFFTVEHAIYTNEIKCNDIQENKTQIAMAPGIFQSYIEKKHELRITVVGDEIFCVKINSQLLQDARVDWRKCPNADIFELGELTAATKNKLLSLHSKLGLVYAAYDFIVRKDSEEVFIECNPSGQWLWLETKVAMNISQAVANKLTSV